jgi:A/G-specific adenine glycosylase
VDGNVYRVLARVFGIDTPIDSTQGRKQFKTLAQELLDAEHTGDHNQAVMELGATVCTPKNYTCLLCPLQAKCVAFASGRIEELPVKEGVAKTRDRYFNYLHIRTAKGLYLRQRTGKDIWQGLWELPLLESQKPLLEKSLLVELTGALGSGWAILSHSGVVKHVLSHQVIHAVFWEVLPPEGWRPSAAWHEVSRHALRRKAVPRLIERWLMTI